MIRKDALAGLSALAYAAALALGLATAAAPPVLAASSIAAANGRETVVRGLEAQYAAVLIKERKLADDRETRLLGAAEARLVKARADLSAVKRESAAELTAARADYAKLSAEIVKRDAAAQTEMEAYRAEAEKRVAQASPEELAALQQFADGDRVVAESVLMNIREARKRATLKAAAMRIALDERATADEHNVMREHGEATTLEVLKLYDLAAEDDPTDVKTNLTRGWLSQQEHDYAKSADAFQLAVDNARTDREREAAYHGLGAIQFFKGDFAASEKTLKLATDLALKLAAAEPKSLPAAIELVDVYIQVGLLHRAQGHRPEAMANFQAALDAAGKADAGSVQVLYRLADASEKVGDLQYEGGDIKSALANHTHELDYAKRAEALDPKAATARRFAGRALDRIGDAQGSLDDYKTALADYQAHNAIFRELAAEDPTSVYYQQEIAAGYGRLGVVAHHDKDIPRSLKAYGDQLDVYKKLAEAHPDSVTLQIGLAIGYVNFGNLQHEGGDNASALPLLRKGLEMGRALAAKDPNAIDALSVIAAALDDLAEIPDSGVSWRDAYAQVQAMKARGQMRPDLEKQMVEMKRHADEEAARAKK